MADRIVPSEETTQLQALHSLKVLDIQPEARLGRVTAIAKRLFGVPIAVLTLDEGLREAREHAETVDLFEAARARGARGRRGEDVFIVSDARADEGFGDTPVVHEGRRARFYASCAVRAPDGRRMGTLCLIDTAPRSLSSEDIALFRELGNLVDEALRSLSMATSDELTKLANRRGFESIAAHILPMAIRLDIPLALVQLDLDDFKQVNDSRGHAAGDLLLVSFARQLLKSFRESDVVARLGGDEFCVLMSGAREANVVDCLERLRRCLDGGPETAIRFSAGVATLNPQRHADIDDLLREADSRMYECKRRKQRAQRASA